MNVILKPPTDGVCDPRSQVGKRAAVEWRRWQVTTNPATTRMIPVKKDSMCCKPFPEIFRKTASVAGNAATRQSSHQNHSGPRRHGSGRLSRDDRHPNDNLGCGCASITARQKYAHQLGAGVVLDRGRRFKLTRSRTKAGEIARVTAPTCSRSF